MKTRYHLVFQGPFEPKPSLTRAPAIDHNHSVAQGRQRVEPQVLDSFEGVIHQLHLGGESGQGPWSVRVSGKDSSVTSQAGRAAWAGGHGAGAGVSQPHQGCHALLGRLWTAPESL